MIKPQFNERIDYKYSVSSAHDEKSLRDLNPHGCGDYH